MKRLFVLLLALVALLTGCDNPTQPYAAKVDGVIIKSGDVDKDLEAIIADDNTRQAINAQLTQSGGLESGGPNTLNASYSSTILTNYIRAVLFERELDRVGLELTPEKLASTEQTLRANAQQSQQLDAFPESYRTKIIRQEAMTELLLAQRSTPEKIQAYYEANKSSFAQSCIRHILVETEGEATALRQRVVNGEDFAAVANESATQQGGQANGGELGCYSDQELSGLVRPFTDAVRTLPVNELSQPVQTQFGFHVIQVKSRQQLSLAEATPQIKQKLEDPNQLVADVFQQADIEVNPRYGDYVAGDPASGTPGQVVPHQHSALEPETPRSGGDPGDTSQIFGGTDDPSH